ncbi:lysophospholipid acyltransferase family protein [Dongia rigui]|uniref:Lysophospholipid acyltransferase family protein n=1 Tax=Dongia rigui TaxID=940149 RepID=A0ABU5E2C4_9PROT|nr:lysophospholipid acyltransferase family protein [Dongia rigui]MDY0873507.1 lysophospholipid acyltransferase family protein [Dongia rigui]
MARLAAAALVDQSMTALRALVFNILYLLWSVAMHIICLPLLAAPAPAILAAARCWIAGSLWLLKVCVGLNAREVGAENLPDQPVLFAVKHQSAWETLYLSKRLNNPAFVLKKELLLIPVFGWFLARSGMIAIDRSGKAAALKKMVADAKATFAQGRPVVIFPEGTRVAPGASKPYQPGIAALYAQLGVPVVPVALNSGVFWGRKAVLKKPGTITIEYLPPIPPGLDRKTFMRELEAQIEGASKRLAEG